MPRVVLVGEPEPEPYDPMRRLAEGRRLAAAKRAKRRRRMARSMLEDQERREWLESKLLRPGEVALLLQVSRRTVSDWARAGRLPFIITPGGHRRFRARDVRRLVDTMTEPLTRADPRGSHPGDAG